MCEWIFTVLLNNTFACLALKQTLQGNNTRLLVEDSLVFQSNTIHFLNLECTTDRGLCCFPSAKVFHQFRRYTWLGDISKTSMPLGLSWSSRFQGRLWNLIPKACTESISTTHYWKSLKNSKQLMKNPNFNLASHCESHFLNLNSLFKKKSNINSLPLSFSKYFGSFQWFICLSQKRSMNMYVFTNYKIPFLFSPFLALIFLYQRNVLST